MILDPADLEHPVHDLSAPERVEYLMAVASLIAADDDVHPQEIEALRAICRELGISAVDQAKIVASAVTPDAARVDAELARVRGRADLSVSLLADAIAIAFANDELDAREAAVLARMADRLGIDVGRVELIARYVESVRLGPEHAASPHLAHELGEAWLHAHPKTHTGIRWLRGLLRKKG
jgi:tellurite resistance protein